MARASLIDRDDEERRRRPWWEQQPAGASIRAPTAIDPVGGEPMPARPTAPRDALDVRRTTGVMSGRPVRTGMVPDLNQPHAIFQGTPGSPMEGRSVTLPGAVAGGRVLPGTGISQLEAQALGLVPLPPIAGTPAAGGVVPRPAVASQAPAGMSIEEMEQRGLSDLERQALGRAPTNVVPAVASSAPLTPEDRFSLNRGIDELAASQKNPEQLQLPGGGVAFRDSDGKYRVAHGANEEVAKQFGLQAADERGVPERTAMRPVQGLTRGRASVGLMDRPDQWSPNRSPAPLILKTPQQERAEAEASRGEALRRHAVPFVDRPEGQRAIDQAEADRTRSRRWGQSGSNTQWERRQREMQRREDDTAQITAERERRIASENAAAAAVAAKSQLAAEQFAETQDLKWAELKQQGENLTAKAVLNHIGDNMSFAQAYRELRDKGYDLNNKKERRKYNKDLADLNKKYFSNVGNTSSIELLGDSLMAPLDEYYRLTILPATAMPKQGKNDDPLAKWRKKTS